MSTTPNDPRAARIERATRAEADARDEAEVAAARLIEAESRTLVAMIEAGRTVGVAAVLANMRAHADSSYADPLQPFEVRAFLDVLDVAAALGELSSAGGPA